MLLFPLLFLSGLNSVALKNFLNYSVFSHMSTPRPYMPEIILYSLSHPSCMLAHQSSLAKEQLHGSLAGASPCGWAHLVQYFRHRKIIPWCDSIIATCLLDQL